MSEPTRARAEEVIERAKQEVFAICKGRHHGGHEWRMSIPVNEERDSDRIIMAGLNAANDLLAAEVQRAVEGEREACAKEAGGLVCTSEDCRVGDALAYRIRARQRAGGYDPEIGYFDAWKGSD